MIALICAYMVMDPALVVIHMYSTTTCILKSARVFSTIWLLTNTQSQIPKEFYQPQWSTKIKYINYFQQQYKLFSTNNHILKLF